MLGWTKATRTKEKEAVCASADFYGWHSARHYGGKAEGFMSFVQPMQGERTIFMDMPHPKPKTSRPRFQGARP